VAAFLPFMFICSSPPAHDQAVQEREKETTKETHQFGGSIGAVVGDVVGNVGDAVGSVVGNVVEDIVPGKLRDMLGNWAGRLPKSSFNSFMSPRKQAKAVHSAHKIADVVAAVEAIRVRLRVCSASICKWCCLRCLVRTAALYPRGGRRS
jgi:hypothetical protein